MLSLPQWVRVSPQRVTTEQGLTRVFGSLNPPVEGRTQTAQVQASSVGVTLRDLLICATYLSPRAGNKPTRNPWFLLRLPGCLLLRYAARQLDAELFHEPPRITRLAFQPVPDQHINPRYPLPPTLTVAS